MLTIITMVTEENLRLLLKKIDEEEILTSRYYWNKILRSLLCTLPCSSRISFHYKQKLL